MKHFLLFLLCFFVVFSFGQETLPVYKKVKNKIDVENPAGELSKSDWIKELPIPKEKVKKVYYVKDKKNKKKKKKQVKWVMQDPATPPEYVPIDCKFGKLFARRADLARFKQAALDLSGEYASATGSIFLKKSPNNPKKFNIIIQNGPVGDRAEIEMGDVVAQESNGHARLTYTEDGCSVDIGVNNRQVTVVQRGCSEYNSGKYKLEGDYKTYKGNTNKVEIFNMPEETFKFGKYMWCPGGTGTCEKVKDDNGKVYITWSKDNKGFIERKAGDEIHTYRPFEHVIPNKKTFYKGEKPIAIKTKRTDISGEWMIWYFYPKAERLKMVRAGLPEDRAYMEIYE